MCEPIKFRDSCASVGTLATEDGAIPKAGTKGPQEVAERSSQVPTEAHATASFSSGNEHARSRASSTGVGVRGDAARSACWFRRIQIEEITITRHTEV